MQSDGQNKVDAIVDQAAHVPVLDRLIARMEVSRTYPIPVVSILSFWVGLIALTVVEKVTGTTPVATARLYTVAWALVMCLELGRDVWVQRHRYATPRWLHAVDAAMGHNITVHALAALIRQHEHDTGYVVTRSDLRFEVQQERARRREAARRAEGFQLVEAPVIDAAQVARDEERRLHARKRRVRQASEGACVIGSKPEKEGDLVGLTSSGGIAHMPDRAGERVRSLADLHPTLVAELLAAVEASAFFTRREPDGAPVRPDARTFRIRLVHAGRSRQLTLPEPFATPELAQLIKAVRRCL